MPQGKPKAQKTLDLVHFILNYHPSGNDGVRRGGEGGMERLFARKCSRNRMGKNSWLLTRYPVVVPLKHLTRTRKDTDLQISTPEVFLEQHGF